MFKMGVAIHSKKTVILGVTCMVPNLGGLLIQTENGHDYQIERHDMNIELVVGYDDGIPEVDKDWIVIDGRNPVKK